MVGESTKTFFVSEPDLAMLERAVPLLHEVCAGLPLAYKRPDVQVAIEECKRILSDVRWAYAPYSQIEVFEARPKDDDDGGTNAQG